MLTKLFGIWSLGKSVNAKYFGTPFDQQKSVTLGVTLYYAGDMEYFGKEHLPYGILAIAVMCVCHLTLHINLGNGFYSHISIDKGFL